jgi:hypothetical protein
MQKKAWIVTVDMGYGHQRAAYPLRKIAFEKVITANSDKIVVDAERKQWRKFQGFYEFVSRLRSFPLIGKYIWKIYDKFQEVSPFYPFRDLSKPNISAIFLHRMLKKNFMHSVIEYMRKEKLPLVSTFFVPAIAAAYFGFEDVYCVVTDSDINRVWVPMNPKKYKIIYLTPTEQSKRRLIQYGVLEENIFYTGFPLPEENIGKNLGILKKDLIERIKILDPNKIFVNKYKETIKKHLGNCCSGKGSRPLTLTFAVGGAGAQKEVGAQLLRSLKEKIKHHKIRVNLAIGMRLELRYYFLKLIDELKLTDEIGDHINLLFALEKKTYFERFNALLHTTDIFWAKPSELSFYTALGLPFVIAPPIGSHEGFNKKWLLQIGSGVEQEDPRYVDQWLFDWIEKGILAELAWNGFMDAPLYGTENIMNAVFAKDKSKVKLKY